MAGDPIVQIRMKYAEELEEILQCPVCMEPPASSIPLCSNGHHVCEGCKTLLTRCPTCQGQFAGARNYLAEDLAAKFSDIKKSILDPNHHINKKILADRKSVQTETDPLIFFKMNSIKKPDVVSIVRTKPITENELYYNCVVTSCEQLMSANNIVNHLREHHKNNLVQVDPADDGYVFFEQTWSFQFDDTDTLVKILNIKNKGLFLFSITVNQERKICGNLQIINLDPTNVKMYYFMSFETETISKGFDGTVSEYILSQDNIAQKPSPIIFTFPENDVLLKCTVRLYNGTK